MPTVTSPTWCRKYSYIQNGYYYPWQSYPGVSYAPTSYSGNENFGAGLYDLRTTNSNPNWKIKVSKAQDASTPYSIRRFSSTPATGSLRTRQWDAGGGAWVWGVHHLIAVNKHRFTDLAYEDAALLDLATKRLQRKMNNRTQSYNSIIPLAELRELRQTIDGAANASMKVLVALADVKKTLKSSIRTISSPKRLRKSLRQAYKDASDIWLTYSFGISPMMGTILDVNKSISSYLTRYDSIDRISGSATKEWKVSYRDAYGVSSCQSAIYHPSVEETHKLQYKLIAGHKFSLASSNDYGALDHFGIKPASLIPAIWELTAFSWVVDYFTTAGEFLDDTFTGTTGNSIYIVKNRKYTVTGVGHINFTKTSSGAYAEWIISNLHSGFYEGFDFYRQVLSSYPPRVLRFRTMDEMGLNGVSKLLNLASVLSKSL